MRFLLLTAILAALTGCATTVTREQWQDADYGEMLDNSVYVAHIQQSVKRSLIDPDSLKMSCADARKGWAKEINRPHQFGWIVYCEVNAKNRLGGYAGAKHWIYLFKGSNALVSIPAGYANRGYDFDFMP